MKPKHNPFALTFLILATAGIIFGGCAKEKQAEAQEKAEESQKAIFPTKVESYCGTWPCPLAPTPIESTAQETAKSPKPSLPEGNGSGEPKLPLNETDIVSDEPEKALPSSKLLSWAKERDVLYGGSSSTIIEGNEYWMYYTGRGIELAKSLDGLNFTNIGTIIDVKDSKEKVDMVTNPSVFKTKDGRYRLIYEAGVMALNKNDRKLYSAISSDGLTWTVEDGTRFQDWGDGKPGEIFTSVPDITRLNDGRLRMYYTRGLSSAIAVSHDEGITWTKEKNLDFGRIAIDPEIVWLDDETYKLFFTSFDSEFGKGPQYVLSASSTDGLNFVLDEGKRIQPSLENNLVTDPDIVRLSDGNYRAYYSETSKGAPPEIYGSEFRIYSAISDR